MQPEWTRCASQAIAQWASTRWYSLLGSQFVWMTEVIWSNMCCRIREYVVCLSRTLGIRGHRIQIRFMRLELIHSAVDHGAGLERSDFWVLDFQLMFCFINISEKYSLLLLA